MELFLSEVTGTVAVTATPSTVPGLAAVVGTLTTAVSSGPVAG